MDRQPTNSFRLIYVLWSPTSGFVLGTRQGDPNCGVQSYFSPSSDWMPPFMRVNPVIDWNYGQVGYLSILYRTVIIGYVFS